MFDRNGTKVTRGTRVLVHFDNVANGPLEWTGKVVGTGIDGRVKVKSEYVTWKPALHLDPANFVRLADQSGPIVYREMGSWDGIHSGRVHVAPVAPDATYYAFVSRIYAACAWTRGNPLMAMVG